MSLIAGIDIGSSSVKISLLEVDRQQIVATNRVKHEFKANPLTENFPEYCQQNVSDIVETLHKCLSGFDVELRRKIKLISICGQMHGCVLWNSHSFFEYFDDNQPFRVTASVSDVYNWQDNRCTDQFLASLPKSNSFADRISSGFGCATIFWLKANSSNSLEQYNSGGTIMDFLVAVVCHLKRPVMSTQNAMSWGYFDPIDHSWNENILATAGFPTDLLPAVQKPGSLAGTTKFAWLGIPNNTPVMVALGDMQCATFASIRTNSNVAVLNVSTSMQLSILMDKSFVPPKKSQTQNKAIYFFPYFDDTYLSVAASLNGGNALQSLIETIKNIVASIVGIEVSDDSVWHKIFDSYKNNNIRNITNKLLVKPTLLGERHDPSLKASISNISNSIELNQLFVAFCEGLIDNIFEMMSVQYLKSLGAQRVIGTGSALLNNPILRDALEERLNIPVIYKDNNDADVGALWIALHYYSTSPILNHSPQS